jgi:hypothetical protein
VAYGRVRSRSPLIPTARSLPFREFFVEVAVEDLLGKHGSFIVDHHQAEVMAGVLGEARALHVRAAIKELYKNGKTACKGVGDVRQLRVTRPH